MRFIASVRRPIRAAGSEGHFTLRIRSYVMVKSKHLNRVAAVLVVMVTVCAVVDGRAEAQEVTKAFKISGSGIGTEGLPLPGEDPRPHWIVGNATHLGRHGGDGSVKTDSAVYDPSIGELGGFVG